MSTTTDTRGRSLRDLRISVTDRCNFRCTYCMPREVFGADYAFLPRPELLTFEEITRFARVASELGVEKLRITGGEPLLRRDIEVLIAQLGALPGELDIALTTNGSLLAQKAQGLRDAGLRRVTVSLDALDDRIFREMGDVSLPVERVLEGIDVARGVGFDAVKVNAVIRRGQNDDQILPLIEHFRGTGVHLRFIEFMDVGTTNGWKLDEVVSAKAMREAVHAVHPVEPLPARHPGEVATRFRFVDGAGEIGFIASVTKPFCGACTRARLSADGKLYTCLFASEGQDVRAWLRGTADEPTQAPFTDDQLRDALARLWHVRDDRYSELRAEGTAPDDRVEMSYIGG